MHPIPTAAHTHSSSSTFRDQKANMQISRPTFPPTKPSLAITSSQSPQTHAMQSVPTRNTYITLQYTPSCVPAIPAGRSPPMPICLHARYDRSAKRPRVPQPISCLRPYYVLRPRCSVIQSRGSVSMANGVCAMCR